MRSLLSILAMCCLAIPSGAQKLTLDSCRAMALKNNKQLAIGHVNKDIAYNMRKSARTNYLPRVSAIAGYALSSEEFSLLNDKEKSLLAGLGGLGIIGQTIGQGITDRMRTDTRSMFAGTVMFTETLYAGGMITAMNNIADIKEKLAENDLERRTHSTIYEVDNTYWLIVSLYNKYELAKSFNKLVVKLNDDVEKMIKEGVATRADGLKVAVKVNESEMAMTQAENGISLAKMLLCQQCGLPMDSKITLADEGTNNLALVNTDYTYDTKSAIECRPETKILENAVEISQQATKIARASGLPQVMMTGGYILSNPNVLNSFNKRFGGMWDIGVLVRVPIWNWFETAYKVRASKATTTLTKYELEEAKEKMELQINQGKFRVEEANKRLAAAMDNIKSAEENLRCADLGFKEGVISSTDVIGAQTAWLTAHSQKIDAEIEVRMSLLNLKKATGNVE